MFDKTTTGNDQLGSRRLSRRDLLKAGAAAGAGLAALSSPLGARGVALARYSEHLARQPLDASTPVNLSFMVRAGPGYHAFFMKAGETFNKQYPNVTINYQIHDSDWATKLKVEMAGGVPPDLVFSSDDVMFSFAARGTHVDWPPSSRQTV
jgi:ABC-type glycerol-3-phosphate transport system substrate-binding protein